MSWYFKGELFNQSDVGKAFGFVYLITHVKSGQMYIGQKQFTSKKTTTAKGKKVKQTVTSDWQDYYSSSEFLKECKNKGDELDRRILYLTISKGQSNYIETMLQMDFRVLENPDIWLNKIMNFRCHHTHVKMDKVIDKDNLFLQELYKKYGSNKHD